MPRILLAASLLAALLSSPPATASPVADSGRGAPARTTPAGGAATAPDAVPGELIVRFRANAGGSERAQARRAARVAVKSDLRLSGAQLLATEAGQSVRDAVRELERHGSVAYAEPNWIFHTTATPNDTRYATELWGLNNTGQSIQSVLGIADADIDAPEAWDLFKDAPGVVVAVADTGVRYDHPDLDGNIWSNPGETANGIDDGDAGNLVDDVRGWDFIDNDNDPTDLQEHGTHVAGTIAAEGNNSTGITGVAWDAQIMPVRVLDEDGSGTYSAIGNGFDYAGDMGAKVLNASLGGGGDATTGQYFKDILDQHPNTLYVVAAGNEANDNDGSAAENPRYPCNVDAANLICVAATDNQDGLASFSNYGASKVDLGAPGVGVMSTVPRMAATGATHNFDSGSLAAFSTAGTTTGSSWTTYAYVSGGTDKYLNEAPADGDYSFSKQQQFFLTSGAYNLAGKKGCLLVYDLYYQFDEGKDGLLVETSTNGTSWAVQDSYTGTNGTPETVATNLKGDNQTVYFRFHTVTDDTPGAVPVGGWWGSQIDNVRVECHAAPDATSYRYFNGTSMASPHVAGVATLLFGAKPTATVAQVRGWLLDSGDALSSLSGKTVTGRRLNALKALQAAGVTAPATPPEVTTSAPTAVTQSSATLNGTVDPNGTQTTYKFVYGTAANAMTSQVPATPAPVGAGTAPVAVSQPLSGLTAGTTYFYKLVAIQGATETSTATQSFQTSTAGGALVPSVTTGTASAVGATSATLAGTVNPNGKATTFHFEYGTSASNLNAQTPTLSAGNGTSTVDVRAGLADLLPSTQYFYRLRASNADGPANVTGSAPVSFTTSALPAGPAGPQGPAGQDGTDGSPGTPGSTGPAGPQGPAGLNGTNGLPGAPGTNGTNGAAGPAGPAGAQGPAGAPGAKGLVTCKVSGKKTRPKVTCKVSYATGARASVRISRAGRLVARGSARRMTKGRALRMTTLRRVSRGRYRLQVTLVERGVKTTLTSTIRL